MREFFLYALEILKTGKDYQILQTNLQPFFWRKVKNIIRQNKKGALSGFLNSNVEMKTIQQYNMHSNQNKAKNENTFVTLKKDFNFKLRAEFL